MKGRVVMLLANAMVSDPRVEKEAIALHAAGWDVVVLAWDRTGDAPSSQRHESYRIERIGPRAAYGAGLKSLPAFASFWRAVATRASELNPDVVHCHDLDTARAGIKIARESSSVTLVMDFHELYRESNMVPQKGLPGLAAKSVVRVVERQALSAADAVLVANPGTIDYYKRLGVRGQLVVVENAPDHTMFRPRPAARTADETLTVGYAGQKRYAGGLLTLVDAVRDQKGIMAVLAGGGTEAQRVAQACQGIRNIEVSGRFSYDELPGLYHRFDVVYAVYEAPIGNVRTLFPVKVMEAMACALPVIVSAGTWIGEYVERHGIGLTVEPGDVALLRDALEHLRACPMEAAAMGCRGRMIVEESLNWEQAAARLVRTYGSLGASGTRQHGSGRGVLP